MRTLTVSALIITTAAMAIGGCASSKPSPSADAASPDVIEIAAAEKIATEIEHGRVDRNWAEVNRHLASVAYTPAQRNASPAYPFADMTEKLGDLKAYELSVSTGDSPYHDDASGKDFRVVSVNLSEKYGPTLANTFNTEFAMLNEDGQWKLAGVRAQKAPETSRR